MTEAAFKANRNGWDIRGKSPRERIEMSSIPEPNSGCWIWLNGLNSGGYGAAMMFGKRMAASRASWLAYRGPIPAGAYVCHNCDMRVCVNPDHLFLGTHADNMRDMFSKGRNVSAKPQLGEKNPRARLTAPAVLHIRASSLPNKILAEHYGVSNSLICMVKKNQIWKHI